MEPCFQKHYKDPLDRILVCLENLIGQGRQNCLVDQTICYKNDKLLLVISVSDPLLVSSDCNG